MIMKQWLNLSPQTKQLAQLIKQVISIKYLSNNSSLTKCLSENKGERSLPNFFNSAILKSRPQRKSIQ